MYLCETNNLLIYFLHLRIWLDSLLFDFAICDSIDKCRLPFYRTLQKMVKQYFYNNHRLKTDWVLKSHLFYSKFHKSLSVSERSSKIIPIFLHQQINSSQKLWVKEHEINKCSRDLLSAKLWNLRKFSLALHPDQFICHSKLHILCRYTSYHWLGPRCKITKNITRNGKYRTTQWRHVKCSGPIKNDNFYSCRNLCALLFVQPFCHTKKFMIMMVVHSLYQIISHFHLWTHLLTW